MSTLVMRSSGAITRGLREEWRRGLLVATDGRHSAEPAIDAAFQLSGGRPFGVIAVLPPADPGDDLGISRGATEPSSSVRDRVTRQLERVCGESPDVWITLRTGFAPAVLASFAEMHDVSLLVVGIGIPLVRDRLLGDEFILRLARTSRTPLFVVAPDRAVPLRRVVVAMDFSATSMAAAKLALSVAAPDANIVFAHVATPTGRSVSVGAMRRTVDAFQTGFCGRVTSVELTGDAATELLGLAGALSADAIAIGTQGSTTRPSGAIGPVATCVIRCSSCSLLIAPAPTLGRLI